MAANERLQLVHNHEDHITIYSRSSLGTGLHLITVHQDGTISATEGVNQRDTSFLCEDGQDKINIE